MKRTQLTSYYIQIRERGSKIGEDLTRWPDSNGFCGVFERFLRGVQNHPVQDYVSGHVMSAARFTKESERIYGVIGGGDFGVAVSVRNIRSGAVDYSKEEHHVDEIPMYFQFRAFPGVGRGLLLLQQLGVHSLKVPLSKHLSRFVHENYKPFHASVYSLVPEKYIRQLLRGGIRRVDFINRKNTGDRFDKLRKAGWDEGIGHINTQVVAERFAELPQVDWITGYASRKLTKSQLVEITGIDFDELKVQVRLGPSVRTVDLSGETNIVARFDITNDVEYYKGLPTLESVHEAANRLMEEIVLDQGIPL